MNQVYEITKLNTALFRRKLLNHFEDHGIPTLSDGYRNIFTFPKGVEKMSKAAGKDYEQDELILYQASEILQSEMFDEDQVKFKGNFSESCQDMTPTTVRFVSMTLYGLNIKNHEDSSQVTRTISQLLLFNSKKRARENKEFRFRHDISRETRIKVYIGLSIHDETRNKSLIEKLYTLGITISYDRVREIEDILGNNVCEQFCQENIVHCWFTR